MITGEFLGTTIGRVITENAAEFADAIAMGWIVVGRVAGRT
jgi:hypothetical protein